MRRAAFIDGVSYLLELDQYGRWLGFVEFWSVEWLSRVLSYDLER